MDSSQTHGEWSAWLQGTLGSSGGSTSPRGGYPRIAARVLAGAGVQAGDTVLDVGTGMGLLAFAAVPLVGQGGRVFGIDSDPACVASCRQAAIRAGARNTCFLHGSALDLPVRDGSVDVVLCRSVLCHVLDKRKALREWFRVLNDAGRFSFFEPVDRYDTRFSEMADFGGLGDVAGRLRDAEEAAHRSADDSLMNFDEEELRCMLSGIGFQRIEFDLVDHSRVYEMTACSARDWWHKDIGGIALPGHASPYTILCQYLPREELDACVEHFCRHLAGRAVTFRSKQLYMWGCKTAG